MLSDFSVATVGTLSVSAALDLRLDLSLDLHAVQQVSFLLSAFFKQSAWRNRSIVLST